MYKSFRGQSGFTLIEILLSIVLLTIILTSFIGFFTQSAKFSEKNNQKLDTIQITQKIIKLIDLNITKQYLKDKEIINSSENVIQSSCTLQDFGLRSSIENPDDYNIRITLSKTPQSLIQVILHVENRKSGEKSKAYTYIRK